ncbi:MAG: hypothetical protein Q7S74_01380 [Nanoarchaeota archaeon]|nr:hypothetical protein [Nanoarchaeota archaeon]
MIIGKKRGLSPVIATSLLIALGLVLAIIIFFWARRFIGESLQKEGSAIEYSCENVNFEAQSQGNQLSIVNKGNVPIYGVEVRKEKVGEILQSEALTETITNGATATLTLSNAPDVGTKLTITPILLGETSTYTKSYPCSVDYGKEITAG